MRDPRLKPAYRPDQGAEAPPAGTANTPTAGTPAARTIDTLYERHWTELCAYLRKTFGSGPPDPEDIAQQAFVNFAALENPAAIDNARAYLYRTAHNLIVDERRRSASHGRAVVALFPQHERRSDDFTPERVLEARERLDVLAAAIRAMPDPRRRSFLYNRLHGLSSAEIARRTGYSESMVKKHISLAMADLDALAAASRAGRKREG